MKATEAKLLDLLKKATQFVIPIYQRTYSWTERECWQLWTDIVRCGNDEKIALHFVGSIVYIESNLAQVTNWSPLLVIDGQQRLTTVSLLLAALAEAVGTEEPFEGFSKRKIRNYYLLNPEEENERHFKLILSQTDEESLIAVIKGKELPAEHSLRIKECHGFFAQWIREGRASLQTLCRGLAKLGIVDVALTRGQDNPQLIFESMNSTGKELSQADLIRNFILMGLEPNFQARLYKEYWRPMEIEFGQGAYGTYFDGFIRHFLTVKTNDIPKIDAVYDAFKDFARNTRGDTDENTHTEDILREMQKYAKYFCAMALWKETDPSLAKAFHDLRELRIDVAYPLLLELYYDYKEEILPKADFVQIVRLIESYVFRRSVMAIPTNSMNKTFANFSKALVKDRYLESVEAHFLNLPSYRRFPSDEEFVREIQNRDLYNFRNRSYWLRRMENYGRKEPAIVDECTIEHIMPQNKDLSPEWQEQLGPDWQNVQEKWLHTIGNLTLTAYNSEYSDHPFQIKRDMEGGFKVSPLKMNEGLGTLDTWNEETIQERAAKLAEKAKLVWTSPKLEEEVLAFYATRRVRPGSLSIADHPNLLKPSLRPLFDAFRKEVLALDECVTEEFLKLYVAYKAESNFADVVPQAKQLKISLNMEFADLYDPRRICVDTTSKGTWGNGNVEVALSSIEELPYIIGLVRQSLEIQLGNASES